MYDNGRKRATILAGTHHEGPVSNIEKMLVDIRRVTGRLHLYYSGRWPCSLFNPEDAVDPATCSRSPQPVHCAGGALESATMSLRLQERCATLAGEIGQRTSAAGDRC